MVDRHRERALARAAERARDQREWSREIMPGTHAGRSLASTPLQRSASSGVAAVSIERADPYGETVTVSTAAGQLFDGGGTACQWVSQVAGPRRAGFPGLAFPTDRLTPSLRAYYALDFGGHWHEWVRGGTVTVKRSGVTLWQERLPFWTHYQRTFDLGVLDPRVGDHVKVYVSPVGEAGAQPDGQQGTFVASLRLVELPVVGVPIANVGSYLVALNIASNRLEILRRIETMAQGDMGAKLAEVSKSLAANTWYGVRCRVQGNTIEARAWPWSETEPSGWEISAVDPAPLEPGRVGVGGSLGSDTHGDGRQCDLLEVVGGPSTDFGEYASGSLPSDWTRIVGTSSAEWAVSELLGATGAKVLRFPPTSEGAGSWVAWNEPGEMSDVEVLARVRTTSSLDGIGVLLRGRG